MRSAALLAVLAATSGCPSFSANGLARPLPPGETQLQLSTGGLGMQDVTVNSNRRVTWLVPSAEFGIRRGVTERLELGGKIWLLGIELNGKYALHRSGSITEGFDLSVAPGASVYPLILPSDDGTGTAVLSYLHLPVLIGFNTSGGHQLVLGPRLSGMIAAARGARPVEMLWAGCSFGAAFRLAPGARVMPELAVLYPVVARLEADPDNISKDTVIYQLSVSYLFGGD